MTDLNEPVAWVCRYPDGTQKFYSTEPVGTFATRPLYLHPPRPVVRLSAVDMLALKPDNEAIVDDQWLVRFAINIELDVLERNGLGAQ